MAAVIGALVLATVVGLVALWPGGDTEAMLGSVADARTEEAEVVGVVAAPCQTPEATNCQSVTVRIESGPDAGRRYAFPLGDSGPAPEVSVGDRLRVAANAAPGGQPGPPPYSFVDFERRAPLLWLAIAFAVLVVAFGRLRGALSLVGLAISLALVVFFVAPAILEGSEPLLVAIVGSTAVMLVTIALAHGLGPKSAAAMLGTAASLALTVGLAVVFTDAAHITGLASEEATFLQLGGTSVSLQGLVLAGIVIGALGVLDDVTVSQASAVMALRRADPAMNVRRLYRESLTVGRDHVSATVNTLVLAYVGASLPIVLIFSQGDTPFSQAVNLEAVATEIVAILVGSIGLIAAVPITTALAALLAVRLDPGVIPDAHAGHAH